MKSYGKFKEFEIRDFTRIAGFNGSDGFNTEDVDAEETGRYDLVKWEGFFTEGEYEKSYCFSIGELIWDKENDEFELKSVGTRFLEHSTEDLNKWLLKWCNLKAFELAKKCE